MTKAKKIFDKVVNVLGIIGIIIGINAIYLGIEKQEADKFENKMISLIEMGIGTKGTHEYIGSVYGKKYEMKISVDDNGRVITTYNWE